MLHSCQGLITGEEILVGHRVGVASLGLGLAGIDGLQALLQVRFAGEPLLLGLGHRYALAYCCSQGSGCGMVHSWYAWSQASHSSSVHAFA